ncbi:MAG: DUF4258 domain-containing protein [Verrucomicrobia bacterium]|nr:DUF4258 domain-containing protein [Verrucomicrobiota bacterium]
MRRQILDQIRQLVLESRYEVTDHAFEEMADDNLLLVDVETAILTGQIIRENKGDPRGTVYAIKGGGTDHETSIGIVIRFNERRNALIITAFKHNE